MSAQWPIDLPGQFADIEEQPESNVVRTATDVGPAKLRRRFTAKVKRYSMPVEFNGEQKKLFDTFYQTTLKDGTLPFEWEDPTDDSTVEFRFRSEPRLRMEVGARDSDLRIWTGVLELEKLP